MIASIFLVNINTVFTQNSNDSIYVISEKMHTGWYIHNKEDIDFDKVKSIIQCNPNAKNYLKSGNRYHYYSHVWLGLGLGLNCWSFISIFACDKEDWKYAYFGAGAIAIGALNIMIAGIYYDNAIEVYNSELGTYKPKETGELRLYLKMNGIGLAYLF